MYVLVNTQDQVPIKVKKSKAKMEGKGGGSDDDGIKKKKKKKRSKPDDGDAADEDATGGKGEEEETTAPKVSFRLSDMNLPNVEVAITVIMVLVYSDIYLLPRSLTYALLLSYRTIFFLCNNNNKHRRRPRKVKA